ncbi:MAG: hypothetical protein IGS48_14905 [Oscillatoriales cyanobacterium C42_A2020_001]|nr:hypothetical protein [Leptolyngbyaceae cyanobacterium C42_A2020_001]
MKLRILALLTLVVLPGIAAMGISTYYLFPEWVALAASHRNYQKLAQVPTTSARDLSVAQSAETRHRLNCFAEGIGVLLGGVIFAIGVHGICTLPQQR